MESVFESIGGERAYASEWGPAAPKNVFGQLQARAHDHRGIITDKYYFSHVFYVFGILSAFIPILIRNCG